MRDFDGRAWLLWLLAGSLLALLTTNIYYLVLLLLISRLVQYACAPPLTPGWRLPFLRISILILVFSALFNLLTAHMGQTVLFVLPSRWPLIGGPITLEAAGYGLVNGLRLVTLLSFFMAFNAIVPVSRLTTLVPGALHDLGIVVLIAFTYVPETFQQFRHIREAQAIRGHRLNGIRALRPIMIPLLISSLERALDLAETMVSRGYGSTTSVAIPRRTRLFFVLGLILILGGALQSAWARPGGFALIAAGALAIVWVYHIISRDHTRTRYLQQSWSRLDTLLVAGGAWPILQLFLPGFDRSTLAYSPYPSFALPPFDFLFGVSLLGLILPVIVFQTIENIKAGS